MKIKIRRIDSSLPLPKYHTEGAAGFDFYCRETVVVEPKSIFRIPLNVAIQIPDGHMILLAARSSTSKRGLMMANGVGIMDRDYAGNTDEYHAVVYNYTNEPVEVARGDRIAQGIVLRSDQIEWIEVEDLGAPDRGGFGTTGL
ncbi:MAG: dUTP diphosphatase [Patescibacteria group bacterium]